MTRQRRSIAPIPAVIDSCCLIDLLASGKAEAILRSTGHGWHMPSAVQSEIQYVRQHDPDNPGSHHRVPVDLAPFLSSGLLMLCQPDDQRELARFIHYATLFRSDGEAMCLALAECRGWMVATDDRKAIRVAQSARLTVISCPEIVKTWAVTARPDAKSLLQVLTDIQTLAQFRPNPTMHKYQWWLDQLKKAIR